MKNNKYYQKRDDIWRYYKVDYTDKYTEEDDTEGLKVLKWSMFDSPEELVVVRDLWNQSLCLY